jgi:hypothetical protein
MVQIVPLTKTPNVLFNHCAAQVLFGKRDGQLAIGTIELITRQEMEKFYTGKDFSNHALGYVCVREPGVGNHDIEDVTEIYLVKRGV